jgi:hypothetical protein
MTSPRGRPARHRASKGNAPAGATTDGRLLLPHRLKEGGVGIELGVATGYCSDVLLSRSSLARPRRRDEPHEPKRRPREGRAIPPTERREAVFTIRTLPLAIALIAGAFTLAPPVEANFEIQKNRKNLGTKGGYNRIDGVGKTSKGKNSLKSFHEVDKHKNK